MGDPLKGDKGTVLLTLFGTKYVRRTVPLSPKAALIAIMAAGAFLFMV